MGSGLEALRLDLTEYLRETCEHHWQEYEGDPDIPAHRQCTWCSDVQWHDGATDRDAGAGP